MTIGRGSRYAVRGENPPLRAFGYCRNSPPMIPDGHEWLSSPTPAELTRFACMQHIMAGWLHRSSEIRYMVMLALISRYHRDRHVCFCMRNDFCFVTRPAAAGSWCVHQFRFDQQATRWLFPDSRSRPTLANSRVLPQTGHDPTGCRKAESENNPSNLNRLGPA